MIAEPPATDEDKEFHKLQYTAVRTLIAQQYDKQYWWLVYVTSANGAIYFWLAEKFTRPPYQSDSILPYGMLVASISITLCGFLLFRINARTSQSAIDYCTNVERRFLKEAGWGDHFTKHSKPWLISTRILISCIFLIQGLLSIFLLIAIRIT